MNDNYGREIWFPVAFVEEDNAEILESFGRLVRNSADEPVLKLILGQLVYIGQESSIIPQETDGDTSYVPLHFTIMLIEEKISGQIHKIDQVDLCRFNDKMGL